LGDGSIHVELRTLGFLLFVRADEKALAAMNGAPIIRPQLLLILQPYPTSTLL
jgi:hypothetical protein